MLTAPGREAMKKSLTGGVFAKSSVELPPIQIHPFPEVRGRKKAPGYREITGRTRHLIRPCVLRYTALR